MSFQNLKVSKGVQPTCKLSGFGDLSPGLLQLSSMLLLVALGMLPELVSVLPDYTISSISSYCEGRFLFLDSNWFVSYAAIISSVFFEFVFCHT